MKIGIDCRLWHEGGVGRYVRNLVYELVKIDKQNLYTLIFLQNTKDIIIQNTNFEIIYTKSKWHTLSEQINFNRELNKYNFDLIHFPYFSHPVFYNKPFVITIHDLTILKYNTGRASTMPYFLYLIKRLGYKYVINHAIYKAQKIIVPTDFVRQDILSNYKLDKDKIITTYEGVGKEFENINIQKPKELEEEFFKKPFFLYVGNFSPHKNIEFLLSVWSKLQKDIGLICVGKNDYFSQRIVKKAQELNLQNKIQFIFNIQESHLAYLYKNTQALILPSLFEGFGLPILEASFFATKCILSDILVFHEVAPNNSIFFDPNNENSLLKIIDNYQKQKLINDQNYWQKFSFANMAKQTLEIYKNCL